MTDDGLRERKKRETRTALGHAAIRLCVERGWANVTVEDIAAEANVSVRTFRNYFGGKAEAIADVHLQRNQRIADDLRERSADEPLWDAITHAVLLQFAPATGKTAESPEFQRWQQAIWLLFAEPALHGEMARANAAAQDELAGAIAARTGTDPDRDVYPKLVAATIGAGCAVAVEHCLRATRPTSLGPVLRKVFDQLAAGLPVPHKQRSTRG